MQYSNASTPILSREAGKFIFESDSQRENARIPIETSVSGRTASFSEVEPKNTYLSMAVTGRPLNVSGMLTDFAPFIFALTTV